MFSSSPSPSMEALLQYPTIPPTPLPRLDLAGITHGFKGDQFTAIHTTARNSPYTVIFAGYICFVIAVYDGSPVASTYTTDIIVSRYGSVYGNIFDHSARIQCVEKSDLVTTTYCHCQFNSCTVSIKVFPCSRPALSYWTVCPATSRQIHRSWSLHPLFLHSQKDGLYFPLTYSQMSTDRLHPQ